MKPLFSKSGLMILEALSFTNTLYAFDFDGTLAKIVPVPSDAKINQTTEALLIQLSKLVPIAIVSGRSVRDLKPKLGFKPHYLVGNHGLEGLFNSRESLNQSEANCTEWKSKLSRQNFGLGVEIEDKLYSLAIHYRRSRNKRQAKAQIQRAIDKLKPQPHIITGKSVINLLPQGAPHKGAAVLELKKRAQAKQVFYIGDDDTDEDVFGLPEPQILTVRVGEKRVSQARFYIERQSQINYLLKILIRNLEMSQNRKD